MKASVPKDFTPVKYFNSLNVVISLFPWNTSPKSATAAASFSLNSPSPSISQLATQIAFTFTSANSMKFVSSTSFIPPLNTSSVHPAAMYASFLPAGTIRTHSSEMPLKVWLPPNANGCSIRESTVVKPEQFSNAPLPMLVTLFGIVMVVRPEHSANASFPILVTLFGMVMEVNPKQCWKACTPMLVTLFGMVMEVRPPQFQNAYTPILVT